MGKLILPLMMYKETGSQTRGNKKKHYVVPTWNHLYTVIVNKKVSGRSVTHHGNIVLDKWAKEYKREIEILTISWKNKNKWRMTENQKVYVDIFVYFPDAKKRDCHNLDKILLDAFESARIFDDDANALVRFQDFEIDIEKPRVEVEFKVKGGYDRKKEAENQREEKKKKQKDAAL